MSAPSQPCGKCMLCYEIGLVRLLVKLNTYLDTQLYGRADYYFLFSCTAKKPGIWSHTVTLILQAWYSLQGAAKAAMLNFS